MFRSATSVTLLATAVAASLLTSSRAAAQDKPVRPAVTESQAGMNDDDAVNMRRLVDNEAVHRDRVARLGRLRALAQQQGQRDRLAEIDRLDRIEAERFAAHDMLTRSRLSDTARRDADDFVNRGGTFKMRRRANNAKDDSSQVVRRPGTAGERSAVKRPTQRATPSRSVRTGSSSSRSGSSSGGRSPR